MFSLYDPHTTNAIIRTRITDLQPFKWKVFHFVWVYVQNVIRILKNYIFYWCCAVRFLWLMAAPAVSRLEFVGVQQQQFKLCSDVCGAGAFCRNTSNLPCDERRRRWPTMCPRHEIYETKVNYNYIIITQNKCAVVQAGNVLNVPEKRK